MDNYNYNYNCNHKFYNGYSNFYCIKQDDYAAIILCYLGAVSITIWMSLFGCCNKTTKQQKKSFSNETYKLLDWIDESKLDWYKLCKNPNAIDYLEQNIEKIYSKNDCWLNMHENPKGITLLKKYPEKIDWENYFFIMNPMSISLFEKYPDKITNVVKRGLSANKNPDAIKFLQNGNYISLDYTLDYHLCSNPNAIHIVLEKMSQPNFEQNDLYWNPLSSNSNAIIILQKNLDKIDWDELARNPNPQAMTLLEKNIHNLTKKGWKNLSKNPNAIDILEKYPEKIDWNAICYNSNAIHLLKKYPKNIYWDLLSSQKHALSLLECNKDKIYWRELSNNSYAIHLIEKNLDKVSWSQLSSNPNAIDILKKNRDKIDWYELSENPSIFTFR